MSKRGTMLCLALAAILSVGFIPLSAANGALRCAVPEEASADGMGGFCGITGECHVDSRVNTYIRVYINGTFRGTIPPYGDIYPFVGDGPNGITNVYAVGDDGRTWSRTITGNVGNYHLILNP